MVNSMREESKKRRKMGSESGSESGFESRSESNSLSESSHSIEDNIDPKPHPKRQEPENKPYIPEPVKLLNPPERSYSDVSIDVSSDEENLNSRIFGEKSTPKKKDI